MSESYGLRCSYQKNTYYPSGQASGMLDPAMQKYPAEQVEHALNPVDEAYDPFKH